VDGKVQAIHRFLECAMSPGNNHELGKLHCKEIDECWKYVEDVEDEVMTSKEEEEAVDYVQIECKNYEKDVDETMR
jgi:hypothetical protein